MGRVRRQLDDEDDQRQKEEELKTRAVVLVAETTAYGKASSRMSTASQLVCACQDL